MPEDTHQADVPQDIEEVVNMDEESKSTETLDEAEVEDEEEEPDSSE